MNRSRARIEHLITGLDTGGAELMLKKLLKGASDRYIHSVTSLTGLGELGKSIEDDGTPVRSLEMKKDIRAVSGILRLAHAWRSSKPALVQTWMYHSDLVGGIAGILSGVPVVWNIRQSKVDPGTDQPRTWMFSWLGARLSGWLPERIVCCSETAGAEHRDMGYCASKMVVIPNGFDLEAFRPDPDTGKLMRKELGVARDELLVGRIGRFHPLKDYATFAQAAAAILKRAPNTYFVMVGKGLDWQNRQLVRILSDNGISGRCILLGRRRDIARIIQALDITVSSSCGEGFPNVVGESMACAVPCVVTDVGDSARIVGDQGRVVPPRNPDALAESCLELLGMDAGARMALGEHARERLRTLYNLPDIVRRYETVYSEVLADVRDRRVH